MLERRRAPGGVPFFEPEATYKMGSAATQPKKPFVFETTYSDLGAMHHPETGEVEDPHNHPVFGKPSFLNGYPVENAATTRIPSKATGRAVMLERSRAAGGVPNLEPEAYTKANPTVPTDFTTTLSGLGAFYDGNGKPVDPTNNGRFGGTSRAWPGARDVPEVQKLQHRVHTASKPVWAE